MDDQLINELANCRELPSMPAAAVGILELAQSDTASMGDVAETVKMDPALTIKILRIANSPLYGGRRKSDNLAQALGLLGMNSTLTLALSFSLVSSLRETSDEDFNYDQYWRRCLLAATTAQALATSTRTAASEDCFISALLQDIGQLALAKIRPGFYQQMDPEQQNNQAALIEYETERLQTDHVEIGVWLLKQWKIPSRLIDAVQSSHIDMTTDMSIDVKTSLDTGMEHDALAQIVNISGDIAEMLIPNPSPDAWTKVRNHALGKTLGSIHWMDSLTPLLSEQVVVVEEMFDMPLLEGRTIESLIVDAREVELVRNLKNTQKLETALESTASLQRRIEEVELKSQLDPLTGLYNRGQLDQMLSEGFQNAVTCNWPYSLVFVDLDFFKKINDTQGHAAGDRVLQSAAKLLVQTTRDTDKVGRYGGEEFVIILPGVDVKSARRVGERLVEAFRNSNDFDDLKVTISAGVATHDANTPYKDHETLLQAADHSMYIAKRQGRDRFICAAA